jgi:hypothetical protein
MLSGADEAPMIADDVVSASSRSRRYHDPDRVR